MENINLQVLAVCIFGKFSYLINSEVPYQMLGKVVELNTQLR